MSQNNQEQEQDDNVLNLFFVFTGEVAKILDQSLFQLFVEIIKSDTPPAATIDRLKSEVFNSSPILMELVAKLEDELLNMRENSKQDENEGETEDENCHSGVESMDVDKQITLHGKSLATYRKMRAGRMKTQSKKRNVGLGGSTLDEEQTPPKKKKKKKKAECSSEGCTNQAKTGGVCGKHGAKLYICSSEGCPNKAKKGGVCIKHGAKVKRKRCSSEGCPNQAVSGGVCKKHGAQVKRCVLL